MTALASLRDRVSEATITDLLLRATVRALERVPELNGTFEDGVALASGIHLGIAVATERGVVVPVIHDLQALDLEAIASERRRLAEGARAVPARRDDGRRSR